MGTLLLVLGMATTRLGEISSFSGGILLLIAIQLALVGLMIAAHFVRLHDRATMLGFLAFLTVLLYGLVIVINEGPFLFPVVSGVPLLAAAWVALKRMRACASSN